MKKRKAILSKHFTLTVPPNINFYLSFKKIKIKNRNFRNSPLCYLQNQLVPRATTGPKSGPSVPKTAKRHPLHTTRYQVSVHLHFLKSQKSYEKVLKPFDFRTFSGPSDWIRTSGLLNPIQARYQTSPHPENAGLCVGQLMYNTMLEKKKQPLFEKIFKLGGTPFAGAPPGRFTLWAAGWKTGYRPGSPCSVVPVPPDTSPWSEPA